jgi:hypothetical protein
MEYDSTDNKESKEYDLDAKSEKDNLVAEILGRFGFRRREQAAT